VPPPRPAPVVGPSLAPAPPDLAPLLGPDEVLRRKNASGPGGTIVAADPASGRRRTLASCEDPCIFFRRSALSPDGRWLAYEIWTCLGGLPCEDEAGLWVTNALGDRIQLTHTCEPDLCHDDAWTWLASGATLVDASGDGLLVFDLTYGHDVLLPTGPDASVTSAVASSPAGTRVAYADRTGVWTVDVTGGEPRSVADLTDVGSIAWSPDGGWLAVDASGEGRDRIYVVAADGSTPPRVVVDQAGREGPGAPAWSPDGETIAYVTTPWNGSGYAFQVWTVGADGSGAVRVAAMPCCIGSWGGPVWSPDGSRIAFGYEDDRYVVPADGSLRPERLDPDEVAGWWSGG
jgi:WD40 repeat protein